MFKTQYAWKIFVPKAAHDIIFSEIQGLMCSYYDGYTQYVTNGAWCDSDKKIHQETTFVYEIVTYDSRDLPPPINHIIDFIVNNTDEEEVLYTKTPIEIYVRKGKE